MNISMTLTANNAADLNRMAHLLGTLAGNWEGDKVSTETVAQPTKTVKVAPIPKQDTPAAETKTPEAESAVTLEMVRLASKNKIDAGKRDAIGGLLQKFGVARVTELAKSQYADFLAEIEQL
ncbi:hypothetical protein ACQKLP_21740 [Chitinophaga sp. NPDC101104]|uniref:hypothetical protein n=1 Tax=Chitinophaga sp. NPDC101104 TaxID=3390561 RepID=UPI003D06E972